MQLDICGKVFMVAGGSRGLGYGIAEALAAEGAELAVASRNQQAIDLAADKLRDLGAGKVSSSVCDVADNDSIQQWRDGVLSVHGAVDGLVVNAGGPPPGNFDDFDDNHWLAAFELTLMSAVRLIRAVLPAMRQRGGGSILVLTSSSIKEPIDYLLLSNVMRSGVTSLAKSLSRSLAAENIRINNLVPGLIQTDRILALAEAMARTDGVSLEQQFENMQAPIPMGRFGRPEEFGQVGAFLLSSAASYITGATIVCDGGAMRTVW